MKKYTFWACMLMAPAAIVSCSDINLGDINTDVAVQVRDLTIPVKMDGVKLCTMLDVDDDSKIKVINGEYAVVVEGDFESDAIHVDPIVIKAAEIEGTSATMGKSRPSASGKKAQRHIDASDRKAVAAYALSKLKQAVAANADKVHEAIEKLSKIGVETSFQYDVHIAEPSFFDKINQVHLENFTVKAPRGLIGDIQLTTTGGTFEAAYDTKTGIVSFSGHDIVSSDGVLHISGHISGIDENLLDDAFKYVTSSNGRAAKNDEKEFAIDEEIGVESGELMVYDVDFKNQNLTVDEMYDSLDEELPFTSQAEMEDIVINSVSGDFQYDVDDVSLDDVKLNDIPDLLRESGTNIVLDNPQIYLYLNNTVVDGNDKAVGASAKMNIAAYDDNGASQEYTLTGLIEANEKDNYIYLSPRAIADEQKYEGFATAKHVAFSSLGKVLSSVAGEEGGLPTKLAINTFNTHVGADNVTDLPLGVDYNLTGRYAFVAPLALSAESRIKYTDTIDGWAEDTEGIVVEKLALNVNATTDVPFELILHAYPINSRGERIGDSTELLLPAKANNAPVSITISGDIRDLDGVKFDVTAVAKEANTLTPDMNISFSDIKVTVSGKYETEM